MKKKQNVHFHTLTVKHVIKNPIFPKVVRQHISGVLVDLIPSLSALHLKMRQ